MSELSIHDPITGRDYFPTIQPNTRGKEFSLSTHDWEDDGPEEIWRTALHPWDGGLASDRVSGRNNVYSKANADASNKGLLLPPPAINTITNPTTTVPEAIVLQQSASNTAAASSSVTYTLATAPTDNNVLYASVSVQGNATIALSGWTTVLDVTNGTGEQLSVLRKVASSEGTTFTFTSTVTIDLAGGIVELSGVNTVTPEDDTASATVTSASINTGIATSTVVQTGVLGFFHTNGNLTHTPPTGLSELWEENSSSIYYSTIRLLTKHIKDFTL